MDKTTWPLTLFSVPEKTEGPIPRRLPDRRTGYL